MTTQETFKQFRDDIKAWVTNNLNAIGKFSGKASDITIDPIDGSDSTNAQEEFERLNSKTGMDLLWENPSPTSDFSAQTISLDLSSYKYIILNVRLDYGDIESTNIICLKELPSRINSTRTTLSYRYVTVSDTGVEFRDARYTNTLGGSATVDNKFAIPYRIYGIKS